VRKAANGTEASAAGRRYAAAVAASSSGGPLLARHQLRFGGKSRGTRLAGSLRSKRRSSCHLSGQFRKLCLVIAAGRLGASTRHPSTGLSQLAMWRPIIKPSEPSC
jgi:hypothetical protein